MIIADMPPAYVSLEKAVCKEINLIENHNLTTEEGRALFLSTKLSPLIQKIAGLNEEIQTLAETVSSLKEQNPEAKEEMCALTQQVVAKMELMTPLLPVLDIAKTVDNDFSNLDAILAKQGLLTLSEQETLERVAFLCQAVDIFSPQE